jgi:hypothetical protein
VRVLEKPDDKIFQIRAVFLGPETYTLPWQARYLAYVVWGAMFSTSLLVEYLVTRRFGFPTYTLGMTLLITTVVMSYVDNDLPLRAVVALTIRELRAPGKPKSYPEATYTTRKIRFRDEVDPHEQAA